MRKMFWAVCAATVFVAGGAVWAGTTPEPNHDNNITLTGAVNVVANAMGGFADDGSDVYNNTVTVETTAVVTVDVRGGGSWGGVGSLVRDNSVTVNDGTIAGKVVGGDAWGTGTPSATRNTVTINNGSITGNVFGAQSGGVASDNKVIINVAAGKTVSLAGEVTGAATDAGDVTKNSVAISTTGSGAVTNITNVYGGAIGAGGVGTGTVTENDVSITGQSGAAIGIGGSVYGGSTVGTGIVSKNTTTLKDVAVTSDIYGGTINNAASAAAVSGNTATLSGGVTAVNVFGGSSNGSGAVTGNKVILNNAGGSIATVFGGQNTGTGVGGASGNSVTMSDGTVTSAVYGGWVKGTGATAAENSVTISGGSFNNAAGIVAGGFVDAAATNGSASKNSVTISGGTFAAGSQITGGQAQGSGAASDNTVQITAGTIGSTVFGGRASAAGVVSGNSVTVSGGTIASNVYGGWTDGTGGASNNSVSVTGGNFTSGTGMITGGFVDAVAVNGSASNNTVIIAGGTFAAGTQIVGGQAQGTGSATGNTVALTGNVQFNDNTAIYGGKNAAVAADATNQIAISNGAAVTFAGGTTNFTMDGGNLSLSNGSFNSANLTNLAITGSVGISNSGVFTLASGTTATIGGPITVSGSGQLNLGAGLTGSTSAITLNGGGLSTVGGTGISLGANALTAGNGSVISIGSDGMNLAALTSTGTITLDGTVKIAIDSRITTIAADTNLVTGGTLSAAAWYEANKNGTGTAIQSYKFKISADGKSIAVEEYGLITSYNETSRRNSANNMASLGVHNANTLVSYSFGNALFNVAQGTDNGDPATSVPGIAPAVFADQTSQAYKNAATTWSILRAFGNMGGGHVFANAAEANSAASAMTGQNQAANVSAMISIAGDNIYSINNRVAANNVARAKANELVGGSDDAMAAAVLNASLVNRLWVGGLGMWENAGARDASNGYKLNTWGFMAGYDRIFGPLTVGGSFGYSQGDFKEQNVLDNKSKIINYAFNLYGTYNHSSGFFATLMGGYAYSPVELRRSVTYAAYQSADYKVNTWTFGGNLGYDWRPLENLTVTPRLGLYYYNARSGNINDGYTSISAIKDHITQLPIDVTAVYGIPMANDSFLDLSLRGGYAYNFNDSGAEGVLVYNNLVGVSPVAIKGRSPGRNIWNIGAGVKYKTQQFDIGVRYDYYSKSSYHAHRFTCDLGMNF